MQRAANEAWFTFSVAGTEQFNVYSFSGIEEVSNAYEFRIEFVSRDASIDLLKLMGKEACLAISDRSGGKRHVHGVIRELEQLHTANVFTHYSCLLVPRFWFLGQHSDHRIYQHMSVTEIIADALQRQGFSGSTYAFKCRRKYEAREYCVQYGESDFHFINRLCEEEGIYYYFEHSPSGHCLCFSDMPDGPAVSGERNLRFFPGSGERADTAVIARLNYHQRVNSDAATFREWNFQNPPLDLEAKQREADQQKAPAPGGLNLEQYRFPHLYEERSPGDGYAELQLLRQLTWHTWIDGETDVCRLVPGFTFLVHSHPRRDINADWWTVSVRHEGEQPQVLEHEAPDRGMHYNASFRAIPSKTRYLPERSHPKNRVDGLQSAVVTGPSGEEVYTDKYGRVKVQFHWDRLGAKDENTTCWVRVADTWAGVNFGFIQLPRIGQEVIVEYMEGDPDRPVITGRVYNAEKMPPWRLPEQKTVSGIQSREFFAGRRNQLVLDDTKDQIQAQLSSDHLLSQLNLGYLTRINHVEGRKDFRGEGFELRTDGWGSIRTAQGLYISTFDRSNAQNHQRDVKEAVDNLDLAVKQHKNTTEVAEVCTAQEYDADVSPLARTFSQQLDEIKGSGDPHSELRTPQMVLAGQAGIAVTTPRSVHVHSGEHTAVTSEQHTSVSTGRSFLVSAAEKVSLFANKLGMRLMASFGKVEIEAQHDAMSIVAEKDMTVFSANGKVHISSPQEILLTAGGSYIKISESGIEQGTNGDWKAKAASHAMEGPATKPFLNKSWKAGEVKKNARVIVRDELGRIVDVDRYATMQSGEIKPVQKHPLFMFHNETREEIEVAEDTAEGMQYTHGFGHSVDLTPERAVDRAPEEEDQ